MGINAVTLSGNVARDAVLRRTSSGGTVISFPLAVGERMPGADGSTATRTSYFDVACFFGTERLCSALAKGSHVSLSGHLRQTRWEQDGQTRYGVEVICQALDIASGRWQMNGSGAQEGGDAYGG